MNNMHLEVLRYNRRIGITRNMHFHWAMEWASCQGHIEVVKYMHENSNNYAPDSAVKDKYDELLEQMLKEVAKKRLHRAFRKAILVMRFKRELVERYYRPGARGSIQAKAHFKRLSIADAVQEEEEEEERACIL